MRWLPPTAPTRRYLHRSLGRESRGTARDVLNAYSAALPVEVNRDSRSRSIELASWIMEIRSVKVAWVRRSLGGGSQ
jgi:hypothetical protein